MSRYIISMMVAFSILVVIVSGSAIYYSITGVGILENTNLGTLSLSWVSLTFILYVLFGGFKSKPMKLPYTTRSESQSGKGLSTHLAIIDSTPPGAGHPEWFYINPLEIPVGLLRDLATVRVYWKPNALVLEIGDHIPDTLEKVCVTKEYPLELLKDTRSPETSVLKQIKELNEKIFNK